MDEINQEWLDWAVEKIKQAAAEFKAETGKNIEKDFDHSEDTKKLASIIYNSNPYADIKESTFAFLSMYPSSRKFLENYDNDLNHAARSLRDESKNFTIQDISKVENFTKKVLETRDPDYEGNLESEADSFVGDIKSGIEEQGFEIQDYTQPRPMSKDSEIFNNLNQQEKGADDTDEIDASLVFKENIGERLILKAKEKGYNIKDDDLEKVMQNFENKDIRDFHDLRAKEKKGTDLINEEINKYLKNKYNPETVSFLEKKFSEFKNYVKRFRNSKYFKPSVIAGSAAAAVLLAYVGISALGGDREKKSEKPAKVIAKADKKQLNQLEQKMYEEIKKYDKETTKEIIDAVAPIKQEQEKLAETTAKQYEDAKKAIKENKKAIQEAAETGKQALDSTTSTIAEQFAKIRKSIQENADNLKKYNEQQKNYQDNKDKQDEDYRKKINKNLAKILENSKQAKKDITELEKKVKKAESDKTAKPKDYQAKQKNKTAKDDAKDSVKTAKADKKEKDSWFFSSWKVSYLNSKSDGTMKLFTSSTDYSLAEKVFNIDGNIGSEQIYLSLDLSALNKKAESDKDASELNTEENSYSVGAGGKYKLGNNVFNWNAGLLFKEYDKKAENLSGGFSIEQKGNLDGYTMSIGMEINKTKWNLSLEKASGHQDSLSANSTLGTEQRDKSTANYFKWGGNIETALLELSNSSEIGTGISYSNEKLEKGDSTENIQNIGAYAYLKILNNLTAKLGTNWETVDYGKDFPGISPDNPSFSFSIGYEF